MSMLNMGGIPKSRWTYLKMVPLRQKPSCQTPSPTLYQTTKEIIYLPPEEEGDKKICLRKHFATPHSDIFLTMISNTYWIVLKECYINLSIKQIGRIICWRSTKEICFSDTVMIAGMQVVQCLSFTRAKQAKVIVISGRLPCDQWGQPAFWW